MKPSHFNRHLKLIMLLLLPVTKAQSIANTDRHFDDSSDPGTVGLQAEFPYWEFILREFVFKTISPPPPANNKLYKRLLEAPFYGGPFPASTTKDDELLSRGDVYHLANGGWIMCQEGCIECEVCKDHKAITTPTVKWTLSRIKRFVPFARPRYDLQVTITPQIDGSFHMKNLSPASYVYVTSNTGILNQFTDTPINRKNAYQPRYSFATTVPPPKISTVILTKSETKAASDGEEKLTFEKNGTIDRIKLTTSNPVPVTQTSVKTSVPVTQTSIETPVPETQTSIKTNENSSSRKRGREISRKGQDHQDRNDRDEHVESVVDHSKSTEKFVPTVHFHPTRTPMAETTGAGCRMKENPRLILGTDQFGEKHVVHVVPVGYLDTDRTTPRIDPGAERVNGKQDPSMVSNGIPDEYGDRPLYRKIFKRVMNSLNDHRSAIEKFLFSSSRPERPLTGPTTVDDAESAGLTTNNYPREVWGSEIDSKDAKGNVVLANGVEVAAQPRYTPSSSNYSTPLQLQQSSTVMESRRSDPRTTTTRRVKLQRKPQLLDPSVANHFDHKMTSDASAGTSIESQSTVGSSGNTSIATAVQMPNLLGEIFDEKSDGRLPQVPPTVAGKGNLDEGHVRATNLRNNSDTLILKEVARSVVNHADTLRGFVAASNSSAKHYPDSDDPVIQVVEGGLGTNLHSSSDRRGTSRRHA